MTIEVTNEYVLNIAFLSFLLFTTLQLFFAILAGSQAMLADCAAMYVDVVTYLFNFFAERMKHDQRELPWKTMQMRRLLLELVPPCISVVTLVAVTVMALRVAIQSLFTPDKHQKTSSQPDLQLMLLFSGLNLLLDFVNVSCFAKADQAVGLPGQHGYEHVDGRHHTADAELPSEITRLVPLDPDETSQDTEEGGLNLNMCSAWTHICADTLRSIAVLVAAGFAYCFPKLLTPLDADAYGSIVVSIIIIVSLGPLLQGLFLTGKKIWSLWHSDEVPKQVNLPA